MVSGLSGLASILVQDVAGMIKSEILLPLAIFFPAVKPLCLQVATEFFC